MLVVHIGPHKTATTYVQINLFANRDALDGSGWIYPADSGVDSTAHHHIAHNAKLFLQGPESQKLKDLGARAKAEGKNIVLSAEGFCRWLPNQFLELARLLEQPQIELVYVLRDPFDRLYSYWTEEVKQGYSKGFPARFVENYADPIGSKQLNAVRELFGHIKNGIKVRVVPFEVLRQEKIDIFQHFCAVALGIADMPILEKKQVNASYPIEFTEFLRLLTAHRSGGQHHIGSWLRNMLIASTNHKDRASHTTLIKTHGKHAHRFIRLLPDDLVKRRLETAVKNVLADHFTLPLEGRSFFKSEEQVYRYYDGLALWMAPEIRNKVISVSESLDA